MGVGLIATNTCEERKSHIVDMHRQRQEKLARDTALNSIEELGEQIDGYGEERGEIAIDETLELGDMVLTLGATNDEIELEITDAI